MKQKKIVMLLAKDSIKSDVRVVSEAKTLLENGYSVKVVAWDRDGSSEKEEEYEGIKVERICLRTRFSNSSHLFLHLFVFNLLAFFKLLSETFDIVHCHDFDTLLAGFFVGTLRQKKVVYDAHEIYPFMIQQSIPQTLVAILSAIELILVRKVAYLITVSNVVSNYFEPVKNVNVCMIMNCKSPEDFRFSSEKIASFKLKWGLENKFVILYDGWLIPYRGLEELFCAVEQLRGTIDDDVMLLICGNGSAEEHLKEIVKTRKLENYVKFAGQISSNKLPLFVCSCDVMYIVYKSENFYSRFRTPSRLFEAIIAEKPVLVSNFGELQKIVNNLDIGLVVDPENLTELLNAILKLKRQPLLRKKFSRKAFKLGETYTWKKMEKKLLNVYSHL